VSYFEFAREVSITDVVAIALSLIALVVAIRANHKANKLQAEGLEIEKARENDRLLAARSAFLTAELVRFAHSASLVVTNNGRSPARDIQILVDRQPISEHPQIHDSDRPVGIIGPGASTKYLLITYDQMPTSYHVALKWRDESPTPGTWESQLTF
jgi:hypothetical protein